MSTTFDAGVFVNSTNGTEFDLETLKRLEFKVELRVFLYQSLRSFVGSGMPINAGVEEVIKTIPDKKFRDVLKFILRDIEAGQLLSAAMGRFPQAFPRFDIALIKVGEKTANWTKSKTSLYPGVLDMLITYCTSQKELRSKVISKLRYPAIICAGILIALSVFVFYVLPALSIFFNELIPRERQNIFIRAFVTFSEFSQDYWWVLPVFVIGGGLFGLSYWRSEVGQQNWMRLQLRLPWLGPIYSKVYLIDFLRLFSTLFRGGLPTQECLENASACVNNAEIVTAINNARTSIYKGDTLANALRASHSIFGGQAHSIISMAEKSGSLDTALSDYADQLQFELTDQLDAAVQYIEPACIGATGIVIGSIAIIFYGSISSMLADFAKY